MKKLEELNLKDAEVLDRSAFMWYSYNSGTGTSGTSGSSGSSGTSGSDPSSGGNANGMANGYRPDGYTLEDAKKRCEGAYDGESCYYGDRGGECRKDRNGVMQCESPNSEQACRGATEGIKCWAINGKGIPKDGTCQRLGGNTPNGLDCFMK